MTAPESVSGWFRTVPLGERRRLYKLYESDFRLFGYRKPDELLDGWEEVMRTSFLSMKPISTETTAFTAQPRKTIVVCMKQQSFNKSNLIKEAKQKSIKFKKNKELQRKSFRAGEKQSCKTWSVSRSDHKHTKRIHHNIVICIIFLWVTDGEMFAMHEVKKLFSQDVSFCFRQESLLGAQSTVQSVYLLQ